jgi:hypothetical protein
MALRSSLNENRQLPTDISLTDNIAHEVGNDLARSTVQELADLIANYASTITGLAFVLQMYTAVKTLPSTTKRIYFSR